MTQPKTESERLLQLEARVIQVAIELETVKTDLALFAYNMGAHYAETRTRMENLEKIVGYHRADGGHCTHANDLEGVSDDDAGRNQLTGESGGAVGEEDGGSGCGNRDAEKPGEGITE